jgi:hypothetical protein
MNIPQAGTSCTSSAHRPKRGPLAIGRLALTPIGRSAIVANTQSPAFPAHAARAGPASRAPDAPSRALRPTAASCNPQTAVA